MFAKMKLSLSLLLACGLALLLLPTLASAATVSIVDETVNYNTNAGTTDDIWFSGSWSWTGSNYIMLWSVDQADGYCIDSSRTPFAGPWVHNIWGGSSLTNTGTHVQFKAGNSVAHSGLYPNCGSGTMYYRYDYKFTIKVVNRMTAEVVAIKEDYYQALYPNTIDVSNNVGPASYRGGGHPLRLSAPGFFAQAVPGRDALLETRPLLAALPQFDLGAIREMEALRLRFPGRDVLPFTEFIEEGAGPGGGGGKDGIYDHMTIRT